MRKLCLPALLLGMSSFAFAQGEPVAPCCNVISVDSKTNLVMARDKITGRLYQFQADNLDIQSIKKNDAVNISGGLVTSVKGVNRSYANLKMTYASPCCTVVSVEPDAGEPCCGVVTFLMNSNKALYKFKAPREVTNTIKINDPVFAEPAGAEPAGNQVKNMSNVVTSGQGVMGMAILYANTGEGLNAYGYPIENASESDNANSTTAEKWMIKANNVKGVTGRLVFANMPKDAAWQIDVYREPDNKSIVSIYSTGGLTNYTLSPGSYTMKLSSMPVEHVLVNRGHDTELRFGLLNVVSGGEWTVLSEKTTLFTRYKPAKVVLPPGSYTLKLGGTEYAVVIKEGKTEEY